LAHVTEDCRSSGKSPPSEGNPETLGVANPTALLTTAKLTETKMAQGAVKKSAKSASASKSKSQAKNSGRVAKPKKAKTTAADKITRKFSSGLVAKTEAMLGQRAGHLELIGKGKKAAKSEIPQKKGGSKKFG